MEKQGIRTKIIEYDNKFDLDVIKRYGGKRKLLITLQSLNWENMLKINDLIEIEIEKIVFGGEAEKNIKILQFLFLCLCLVIIIQIDLFS